jgi:hypothetical protein
MPSKPNTNTHMKVLVEGMDRALVWKIDQLKEEMGLNRSDAISSLLWLELQHKGFTKAGIRADYEAYLSSPRNS